MKILDKLLRTPPKNKGYSNHGASRIKKSMIGWLADSGSPDEDITDNLPLLRKRSRDLYMGGSPIATGALKTLRTNVVGAGLRPKPHLARDVLGLDDETAANLERQIEQEFNLWGESKDCDASRMNDFYELQQLVFLSQLMSGEVFVLLPYITRGGPYGLKVQIIESDLVWSNDSRIKGGIERGEFGEPTYYHVHTTGQNYLGGGGKAKRIRAYGRKTGQPNILHIMESERPGQVRGVPILSPVIESVKQLGRYQDAELMAAVVSAMYSLFITSDVEAGPATSFGESIPEVMQVDQEDDYSYELGNGSIMALAPGEKVQEANPGRPNTAFDGFVQAMCRQIGAALEIPKELLLKEFNSSYSASRASLLEAWKMFKMRRSWLVSDFCQPVYEQWFFEAVAKGRIQAPGFFSDPMIRKAYMTCEWSGPTQGQIDPLKEVNAAARRVEEGFSTRQKETVELTGGDYENNIRQIKKEEKLLQEVRTNEADTN